MLHRVRDLSPENRHAIETLLGHPVSDDDAVSIRSLNPLTVMPAVLSPEDRIATLNALNARLAGPLMNLQEEDAAVDEAMRVSSPDFRRAG